MHEVQQDVHRDVASGGLVGDQVELVAWLDREFPTAQFERYADDAVVHCVSERQARQVLAALGNRMEEVGLWLHPDKTKIVYCQDGRRRGSFEHTSFTFLGFTFRQRRTKDRDARYFLGFLPSISKDAQKKIGETVRSWRLHRQIGLTFAELARRINPIVAGWMQYYGRFDRAALYPLLARIDAYLVRWVRKKYKRLAALRKALQSVRGAAQRYPRMFAHWKWVTTASSAW